MEKFDLTESDKICPSCGKKMVQYTNRFEGTDLFGNRRDEKDVVFHGCPDCEAVIDQRGLSLRQDRRGN